MKNKIVLFLSTISMSIFGQIEVDLKLSNTIPDEFTLLEKTTGDLNKDGTPDTVYIIKATDQEKIIINRHDEKVDRNRRGIIVMLSKDDGFDTVVKNYDCFTSENEDGGVYFPPELSIEIKKGNLYVKYNHGRYGQWHYIFRYQHSDFELIGYDNSQGGVVVEKETSINFLTKRKQLKVNTNEAAEGGDEVYEETWEDIKIEKLIRLSEIEDFYELDMLRY